VPSCRQNPAAKAPRRALFVDIKYVSTVSGSCPARTSGAPSVLGARVVPVTTLVLGKFKLLDRRPSSNYLTGVLGVNSAAAGGRTLASFLARPGGFRDRIGAGPAGEPGGVVAGEVVQACEAIGGPHRNPVRVTVVDSIGPVRPSGHDRTTVLGQPLRGVIRHWSRTPGLAAQKGRERQHDPQGTARTDDDRAGSHHARDSKPGNGRSIVEEVPSLAWRAGGNVAPSDLAA